MFVVTKDGKKLPVDDSGIDYAHDEVPFLQTVGLYTNDTILKPVWYVTLYVTKKGKACGGAWAKDGNLLDYETEIYFDHEPTQEEILSAMAKHGLTRYDCASVGKFYELDME